MWMVDGWRLNLKNMKKILSVSSFLATLVGIVLVLAGFWGICFTYKNVSKENIITSSDASVPGKKVIGPWTLKSQADVIRKHTLNTTSGQTFAEMPRLIEKLDENGVPVLDQDGNPIMEPNSKRDIWITATTLITALHLGILTYVFSGLILLFGLISIWTGIVFFMLSKKPSITFNHH